MSFPAGLLALAPCLCALAGAAAADPPTASRGWRVLAAATAGEAWDVQRLRFLTESGELGLGGDAACAAVGSGDAGPGFGPENAFRDDDAAWWAGRAEAGGGALFLGLNCTAPQAVRGVQLQQRPGAAPAQEVRVQALADGGWATLPAGRARAEMLWTAPGAPAADAWAGAVERPAEGPAGSPLEAGLISGALKALGRLGFILLCCALACCVCSLLAGCVFGSRLCGGSGAAKAPHAAGPYAPQGRVMNAV